MGLRYQPCQDSPEHAQRVAVALKIDRGRATDLGESAVDAIRRGWYLDEPGARVDWSPQVNAALAARRSYPADEEVVRPATASSVPCRVMVVNESTLMVAHRLVESGVEPLALNFANGVTPGGGFLHGGRAQEEVLCRSSALYATLVGDPMYAAHRRRDDRESSAALVVSPSVPVFRLDDGTALAHPWVCGFITCAAPVAWSAGQPRSGDLLRERIERVLDVAIASGYRTLVLGAWGCGAFGNDPVRTARDFHAGLRDRANDLDEVVFAISDWSSERWTLGPFRDEFIP